MRVIVDAVSVSDFRQNEPRPLRNNAKAERETDEKQRPLRTWQTKTLSQPSVREPLPQR